MGPPQAKMAGPPPRAQRQEPIGPWWPQRQGLMDPPQTQRTEHQATEDNSHALHLMDFVSLDCELSLNL